MPSFKFYSILVFLAMILISIPSACNMFTGDTKSEPSITKGALIEPAMPAVPNPFDDVMPGDLNFDGQLDIADLQIMIEQQKNLAALDFDGNGKFDVKDFEALKNHLFLLKGKK